MKDNREEKHLFGRFDDRTVNSGEGNKAVRFGTSARESAGSARNGGKSASAAPARASAKPAESARVRESGNARFGTPMRASNKPAGSGTSLSGSIGKPASAASARANVKPAGVVSAREGGSARFGNSARESSEITGSSTSVRRTLSRPVGTSAVRQGNTGKTVANTARFNQPVSSARTDGLHSSHVPTGGRRFEGTAPAVGTVRPAAGHPIRRFDAPVSANPSFGFGKSVQDAARMLAFNVLQDVSRADAYASLALSDRLRASALDQRDKNFVSELVYGTLERRITLDYLLDRRMQNPQIDPGVRDILRMGAYQILYLDRVPDSAAVNEAVNLCRAAGKEPFAAMVNAILRGLSREKDQLSFEGREEDFPAYLSVTQSVPRWICERLIDAYGPRLAEEIVSYRPDSRWMTIRRTPDRSTPESFERMMTERRWEWKYGRIPNAYVVSGIGDVGIEKAYLQGLYTVQSESSMLAAMAVAPKRGSNVLDACAAPGGKTACLAELLTGTGRVYAWDLHEHRVELIHNLVKRLGLDNVRAAVRDASVMREDLREMMDAVLIDAPCSGFGVMLSKPDVKYRPTPESVKDIVRTQRAILESCSSYVRPGGTLVYSTCTILPEENTLQIQNFLNRHPEFEMDDMGLRRALPDFCGDSIHNGEIQMLAHREGMDGFYIARLRKSR